MMYVYIASLMNLVVFFIVPFPIFICLSFITCVYTITSLKRMVSISMGIFDYIGSIVL